MINAQKAARRRAAAPDANLSLRWDDARKRWEATLTHRQLGVLGVVHVETTVPMDRATGALLLGHVRSALEGMLPF